MGYLRDKAKQSPNEWQRLVDKYPNTQEAGAALYRLGFVALKQGDPDTAVKRFLDVAKNEKAGDCVERSLVEAGYAHISRYWKTGENAALSDAMRLLTSLKNRKLSKTDAVRVRLALGESCLLIGYCKEAAEQYQQAFDLNPTQPYLRGVAQFELGCALYGKGDFEAAVKAFDSFLGSQTGASLLDKDRQWRSTRPGYIKLVARDNQKAQSLTGLELVPLAAYWKAESLRHLRHYSEAGDIADELMSGFPNLSVRTKAKDLQSWCESVKEAK